MPLNGFLQNNNTTPDEDLRLINTLKETGYFGQISRLELHNKVILAYNQDENPRL